MDRRSLVLVEDDAGDAFLVAEMLFDTAPNVTRTSFTTLQAALDGWPSDAACALLDLGLPDAMGLRWRAPPREAATEQRRER